MNTNTVAKHYDRLTPQERFRLIVAAGARGDEAEQTRLINSAERIRLSVLDYFPHAEAFDELALAVFIELLEDAARFLDAFHRADDADFIGQADSTEQPNEPDEDSEAPAGAVPATQTAWLRCLDIARAAGYVLQTKAAGWKLFCTRLTIPPFARWQALPGFERLERALALAEAHADLSSTAFTAEGMLHWLNAVRPEGEPAVTQVRLTAEVVAGQTEELFRGLVSRLCP
jgi:hypothetical protein